mmetsp:Transcript_19276/g.50088  ORF Transcript_19276/g.50088 Transcript_19276/m.50088 type:complete len:991 (-) Transcript_19276:743-3715(-)
MHERVVCAVALLATVTWVGADEYDWLYCNPEGLPPDQACCLDDDSCYRCFDIAVQGTAVRTRRSGTWILREGAAKGIAFASNVVIPAPTEDTPPAMVLTATANQSGVLGSATVELESPSPLGSASDFGVVFTTRSFGRNNGNLTFHFGNASDFLWRIRVQTSAHMMYCASGAADGTEAVFGSVDLSGGGKIDPTKASFTIEVISTGSDSKNGTVNATVTVGGTVLGTCSGLLSGAVVFETGTATPTFFAVTNGSAISAIVADIQLSDSLLPARPSSRLATGRTPIARGVGVELVNTSTGLLLVQNGATVAVLSLEAETAVPILDAATGMVVVNASKLELLRTERIGVNAFSQTWSFTTEPHLAATVNWTVATTPPRAPMSKISSLVNATAAVIRSGRHQSNTVMARLTFVLEITDAAAFAPHTGTSFASKLNTFTSDVEYDVTGANGTSRALLWGTLQMSLFPNEINQGFSIDPTTGMRVTSSGMVEAVIPVMSVRGRGGGLMMMAGARSSFMLQTNSRFQAISRIFFLHGRSRRDEGYFNGDVNVKYDFAIGVLSSHSDWADQYAVYTEVNPWMRQGPKLDPPGTVTGFPGNRLPSATDGDTMRALHTRIVYMNNNPSEFYPRDTLSGHLTPTEDLLFAKAAGAEVQLWSNARMAPNTTMCPYEDKDVDYREFLDDSAMWTADGKLIPCWDGFSMNPATDLSYGQFQIERIMSEIVQFNLSGLFFDFYGDTTDSDHCRTYAQFPFYPLQVAELQFIKAIRSKLDAIGGTLNINCPHSSMQMRHLADSVSCDSLGSTANLAFSDSLAHRTAGLPSLLLRNILPDTNSISALNEMLSAVFYGVVPSLWQSMSDPTDQETAVRMLASSVPLSLRVAAMMPAGGSFDKGLWWVAGHRGNASAAAITLRYGDSESVVGKFDVSLQPNVALANTEQELSLLLWDGIASYVRIATGTGAQLTVKRVLMYLAPGTVKALLYVPTTEAKAILDDFAYA